MYSIPLKEKILQVRFFGIFLFVFFTSPTIKKGFGTFTCYFFDLTHIRASPAFKRTLGIFYICNYVKSPEIRMFHMIFQGPYRCPYCPGDFVVLRYDYLLAK